MSFFTYLALYAALAGTTAKSPAASLEVARPIRIVYYYPADTLPPPGYRERLAKVMHDVQAFYARGMEANGWGRKTFTLEEDGAGLPIIHLAKGRLRLAEHKRGQTEPSLHEDVNRALRTEKLDLSHETIMVFSNLLIWKEGKAIEVGPFYGSGDANSGSAYAYDDPHLDPDLLGSRAPGGYYYDHACSLGEFNSHYIGGIIHELGHGLGLPHDKENQNDRDKYGLAIMGGGNHTYGAEKRGEGKGSFMTAAEAMMLSHHPLFLPTSRPATTAPGAEWKSLDIRQEKNSLRISGMVSGTPETFGVIAYNDPEGGSDYNAISAAARTRTDGTFDLTLPDLEPGQIAIRLCVCHTDGSLSWVNADCRVAEDGKVDIAPLLSEVAWRPLFDAIGHQDRTAGRKALETIRTRFGTDDRFAPMLRTATRWLQPTPPQALDRVPEGIKSVAVSDLAFMESKVGWGEPLRDRVIAEGGNSLFLKAGETVYERGLFAHAPSRYALSLHGRWNRLQGACAVQQGTGGTVVFVIRGDGRELFRSRVLRSGSPAMLDVDLRNIDRLELLTEDGGDGASGDWGVWLNPTLLRGDKTL